MAEQEKQTINELIDDPVNQTHKLTLITKIRSIFYRLQPPEVVGEEPQDNNISRRIFPQPCR